MADTRDRDDRRPARRLVDAARDHARRRSEGSQLPSEAGMGPGAGDASPADRVDAEPVDAGRAPHHPSLGPPPGGGDGSTDGAEEAGRPER